jgi:hypothetical protein
MIRDPLGGWDWDGIRQLAFMVIVLCVLITLFAELDSNYEWYTPWESIANFVGRYPEFFIGGAMILLLAGYWLSQFDGGYY